MTTVPECTPDLLRSLFLFEALSDDRLEYLCERGQVVQVEPGWLYREGDDATCFFVLLDGSLVMSRNVGGDEVEVNRSSYRGAYVGAWNAYLGDLVPQVYDQSVRVTETSDFFELDATVLRDIMREWFPMAQHLLAGLFQGFTTRQRNIAQRERLLALGSLSAGLTHELNNPAAAAVRATSVLQQRVSKMREKLAALAAGHLDEAALQTLIKFQDEAAQKVADAPKLTALESADREDDISDWLEDHGVGHGFEIASTFVAAGIDGDWLDLVANAAPPDSLSGRAPLALLHDRHRAADEGDHRLHHPHLDTGRRSEAVLPDGPLAPPEGRPSRPARQHPGDAGPQDPAGRDSGQELRR